MDIREALLDSWDRQCRIVDAVATRIDESNRKAKPSEDGWPLDQQLSHMHGVRCYFLKNVAPDLAEGISPASSGGEWGEPLQDLNAIKSALKESGAAVRKAVERGTQGELAKFGWYDNPVLFMQHMVWHEGWHVGLIFLALRLAGQEPGEEWEEPNVWGEWRTEEW